MAAAEAGQPGARTSDDVGATRTYRRAGSRVGGGILTGIGAVLFVGGAVVMLLNADEIGLVGALVGAATFGFFGVFLGVATLGALPRGTDRLAIEIGPAGVRLPEMGFLSWAEIAEVRLEVFRGVGSSQAPVTARYRRLGFVPRDSALRPGFASTLGLRMLNGYAALVRAIAPQARFGGDGFQAPFGVTESDVPRDFEELVEVARRYAPVIEAAEARARARAPRWTTSDRAGSSPVDLASLDAGLGRPRAGAAAPAAPAVAGALGAVAAAAPASPRATFGPAPIQPLQVVLALVSIVAPLVLIVPVTLTMSGEGGSLGLFGLVFLAIFVLAFVGPGILRLARLARRARERGAGAERLRVGPDGLWLANGGSIEWPAVRQIRTERAGWTRDGLSPRVERWQLVVEAEGDGGPRTASVASDELGAPFDDVLDVIRFYHPVTETA